MNLIKKENEFAAPNKREITEVKDEWKANTIRMFVKTLQTIMEG